jgi:hypothetical protein
MSHRDGLGRLALVCPAQSADLIFVRLPWRIPSLITESRHKDENDKPETNEQGKATEMVSVPRPAAFVPQARDYGEPQEVASISS